MKKFSLNGKWNMIGGGYNCDGNIPGSVYSFLLDNKLMDDPYYRTNELEATPILENDFVFSRKFDFTVTKSPVLLHCDGLDTLCDIKPLFQVLLAFIFYYDIIKNTSDYLTNNLYYLTI